MITYLIYFYLILNFGNSTWYAEKTWSVAAELILSAVITFIVGCFLVIRLWYFSKGNIYLVAFCGFFAVAQLAVNLILPIRYFTFPSIAAANASLKGVGIAGLVTALISDISVSGSLCYYLEQGRNGFRGTNDLITKLIAMTIMTGLLPTLVMIADCISFFVSPESFWSLFFNFPLSQLYINVVLTSLNSRKTLRDNIASRRRDEMDFTVFSSAGGRRVSQALNDDTARMLRSQTGQGGMAVVNFNIEKTSDVAETSSSVNEPGDGTFSNNDPSTSDPSSSGTLPV
ncbi:hypothetical protein HYPSUDRAFT_34166 [Hypholoma sublateritium FD-334 SS-4]|uniref:DUF6534 domain-containing protein n=1 Tax=Hypholoma sublateritium (strain FD-334 SS-4) TaxID=945553 RepID=A0A0D2LJP9_HYPSF|nr:hypothetical protein HYPSUDRAFT_34166 [Hypholoma sublateritium FD-334 SS-4]